MTALTRSGSARWALPVGVLVVIALISLSTSASGASTPDLKPLTAQALIEKVQAARVTILSGTIELKANLGIPNLTALQGNTEGQGFNPLSLLSGTHHVDVSYDGPERQRVALPGTLSETDVYRDGVNLWTWDSVTSKATHYILPSPTASAPPDAAAQAEAIPSPADLAKEFLDRITPSTDVSVTTPSYVADQPVYELVLAPKAAGSTIDHVAIAVDAVTGLPLRVSIAANGQKSDALSLGYSSIHYTRPSGPFTFTPPPGATVVTHDLAAGHGAAGPEPSTGKPDRAELADPAEPSVAGPGGPGMPPSRPTVLGHDWLSVAMASNVQLPKAAWAIRGAASPVSGAFGSGSLLETKLVNVLFLDDGRVAAGFVTPAALEAAVARG